MVKVRVNDKEKDSAVFESDPMETADALEVIRVMLKPSMFGVNGFQIVIERV